MSASLFFLMNPCAFLMASVLSAGLAFLPTQTQMPQLPLSTMKESSDLTSACIRGPFFTSVILRVPSSSEHLYSLMSLRVLQGGKNRHDLINSSFYCVSNRQNEQ